MRKVVSWIKSEAVLSAAFLAAAVSAFFVPPDGEYPGYLDFRVLSLLFCLMAVVAGITRLGALEALSQRLAERVKSSRGLSFVLVFLCFFSSMFLTNDVALLTFVPLSLVVLGMEEEKHRIFVIVMQTVAANLGSMLMPVGNPQNLFLYSRYHFSMGNFLQITAPLAGISLLLVTALLLFRKNHLVTVRFPEKAVIRDHKRLVCYGVLFVLCLLTVFGVVGYWLPLIATLLFLLFFDRKVFRRVDYPLLLTFVFFFIFVGNIARIGTVSEMLSSMLAGRELLVSALASQVISNVPAAMMLAGFTEDGAALVAGTNIGGLGTLVASLASLISFKLYAKSKNADKKEYFKWFSIVNFGLLIVLLGFAVLVL